MSPPEERLVVTPIGAIHTPFPDRASAPRQPAAARGVAGTIELRSDGRYAHALEDLDRFRYIWVLFWFHLNDGWRPKVLPPRSAERRGVFATRSPHRPNPIGMSVLRLERIEGLTLHVLDVDMIDGTPVLDVKPYLPYTDAIADADHGWLGDAPAGAGANAGAAARDPRPGFAVEFTEGAHAQLAFLATRFSIELESRVRDVLGTGPSPHPYRRIKKDGDGFVLAAREWRVRFRVNGACVTVERIFSGYRPSALFGSQAAELAPHREYTERFGASGERG